MAGVLVDTSVWVRHFRRTDPVLVNLLMTDEVLVHPLVLLEVACGTPPAPRSRTLSFLGQLGQTAIATPDETLALIERKRLFDKGCGAVDMSLLASALLTPGASLWTHDRPLQALAVRLGVAFRPATGVL